MRVISKRAGHVIPVRPSLVRLLGRDHIATLYLTQLSYYDKHEDKDPEGYFTKSVADIEWDTALTRTQQDRVRSKLVRLEWIAVKQSFSGHRLRLLRELQ